MFIADNLTAILSGWAAVTVVAIVAISICNGCCIAKMLGKPCKNK